jgi:glycosyltransferase involved in cell wall biosynthesis
VILCGPFLGAGQIGGYGRCNELIASSPLMERFGVKRLPVTLPGEGSYVRRMLVDLARTRRCLKQVPAPIFHVTAQYYYGTYREYAQYRMAKRARRSFVYDIRAGSFVEAFEGSRVPLERRLLRRLLEGADAITVEGRSYVDWIAGKFGKRPIWFPNFVQLRHRDLYPRAALDRPLSGRPLQLVYAGRLVPQKGLEELVRACALVESRGVGVQLNLLGSGEPGYEAQLQQLAGEQLPTDRVVFHGVLRHEEVLRFLATQHIFAFPTRWPGEGHSNVVNEAMQIGLPIVTTRQGFLGDVVTPECGVVLSEPEPEALAKAVLELASDWDRLRGCGAAAYERVYREFADAVVLARLADLYQQLLHGRGEGPSVS